MPTTLNLELADHLYAALTRQAEQSGVTPAQWLHDALRERLAGDDAQEESDHDKLRRLAGSLTPFDLPIGVYVVNRDGRFIKCHERVREMLRLPPDGETESSILDFYRDPEQREKLAGRLAEQERAGSARAWLEKEVLEFAVEGREVFIQDHTRSLRDPDTNATMGYICCMVDVTEEENYRRLFDRLPIGVYRLDARNHIEQANQAMCEMLGYQSADEVEGRPTRDFYADPDDAPAFQKLMDEEHTVIDHRLRLKKKNGEHIYVSISAFRDVSPDGQYLGRGGIMMDVTREERYKGILDGVPVGLYVVRTSNGDDCITDVNNQFVELLEFDNAEEAYGFDIKQLHATDEECERFMRAIREAPGQSLHGYRLRVKTRKGTPKVFEINSRLLHKGNGEVIGRVGAVRDISEEDALREKQEQLVNKVKELTHDIGAILHTFSTALVTINQSFEAVRSSLKPDPFKAGELRTEQATRALAGPARLLADLTGQLIGLAPAGDRAEALPADAWNVLEDVRDMAQNYASIAEYEEFYPSLLREAALKFTGVYNDIQKGKLPREKVREARAAALELLRICNLIVLHQVRDVTVEIDYVARALREYVVTGAHTEMARTPTWVQQIVSQAVNRLQGFAKHRGVQLEIEEIPDLQVNVAEHEIVRALSNLLHNAIKYSWDRKNNESPWVSIRALADKRSVAIECENWGVPIHRDEIEKELIFKLGYRGQNSSDRGRAGTGIGLTDARRVAEDHGGSLSIRSRPARSSARESDKDYYKHPFITTAVITLPLNSNADAEAA
jgi:two-component system sensor histidine kinase SenX3